jgi:hypothetical protein
LAKDHHPESPIWVKKLLESKAGIVAQVMLTLMLVVSIGGIAGIVIWETVKGIFGAVTAPPEIFVAAVVGAAVSTIGFGLFAVVLGMLGPILSVVYEEWTAYIAPVIGGTAGAAISGGLAVNAVYIVALSALTGGITLVFYSLITAKEEISLKGISELVIAGVGFGAIDGVIVAAVLKLLEVAVGIDWMLAG